MVEKCVKTIKKTKKTKKTKKINCNELYNKDLFVTFYLSMYKSPNNNSIATKWLKEHLTELSTKNMNFMNKVDIKYYVKKILNNEGNKNAYLKKLMNIIHFLPFNEQNNIQNKLSQNKNELNVDNLSNLLYKLKFNTSNIENVIMQN